MCAQVYLHSQETHKAKETNTRYESIAVMKLDQIIL